MSPAAPATPANSSQGALPRRYATARHSSLHHDRDLDQGQRRPRCDGDAPPGRAATDLEYDPGAPGLAQRRSSPRPAEQPGLGFTSATRRRFATDLLNLTLAGPRVNRYEKVDDDAAEWLPAQNGCWFAARVVAGPAAMRPDRRPAGGGRAGRGAGGLRLDGADRVRTRRDPGSGAARGPRSRGERRVGRRRERPRQLRGGASARDRARDARPSRVPVHARRRRRRRGVLAGACAGWSVRPTSVELYDALRADNATSRQRSIAIVLINEVSFEEIVNAHTEGAFTWRQLARAARAPYRHCGSARSTPSRHRLRARTSTRPARPQHLIDLQRRASGRGADFVTSWAAGGFALAFKASALWIASQSRPRGAASPLSASGDAGAHRPRGLAGLHRDAERRGRPATGRRRHRHRCRHEHRRRARRGAASASHRVGSASHRVGSASHRVGSASHRAGSASHRAGSASHRVGSASHRAGAVLGPRGKVAGTDSRPAVPLRDAARGCAAVGGDDAGGGATATVTARPAGEGPLGSRAPSARDTSPASPAADRS